MTATNSSISAVILLSVICLGLVMVFVGGWYLQSSLVELKAQQQSSLAELKAQQQSSLTELKAQQQFSLLELKAQQQSSLLELKAQQLETAKVMQQLKEKVKRQNKQIIEIQLQLQQAKNNQFAEEVFINNTTLPKHGVLKRSTADSTSSNEKQLEILRGRDGRDGRDGLPGPRGIVGPAGPKGDTGVPGPKGDGAGGVVYVRWGHNSCPSGGAQLVYTGRAGGSHYTHKGGGGNPQCLPLDPTFYKTISGVQNHAYIYGAEYEGASLLVSNSPSTDVPCAVCYVPTRNALYMIPAKYDCPKDWTREYFGYLMSECYNHHRSQFSCVDHSLTPVTGSSPNQNAFLFYPIEGVCGSLPCPPYSQDKELSCAVCTK